MFKHHGRSMQTFGLLVFLALIISVAAMLARTGGAVPGAASRAGASAALDSPLPPPAVPTAPAEQAIPVPALYYPTPLPVEHQSLFQPVWLTYEVPGEGLTFQARQDWVISSGKSKGRSYTTIHLAFWDTGSGMVIGQRDNPEQLPLEVFAKTRATAGSSSGHGAKWLAADIRQHSRDVSNDRYQRLLIVRDDQGGVTNSINGPSEYTVLIAYDKRVVIARSDQGMSPAVEQHFWEVLDSITFTTIQ